MDNYLRTKPNTSNQEYNLKKHITNEHGEKVNPAKDVTIGDRVWIGYGATILKGSVIENDSIIGTQSVVTGKHIPEGSIAAGNPVKILKQGFHWGREKIR